MDRRSESRCCSDLARLVAKTGAILAHHNNKVVFLTVESLQRFLEFAGRVVLVCGAVAVDVWARLQADDAGCEG